MARPTPPVKLNPAATYPVLPKNTRDVNDPRYQAEVTTAVANLSLVRNQQKELSLQSSDGSLSGFVQASQEEVRKLITNDPAYRDAAAILYAGMASQGN